MNIKCHINPHTCTETHAQKYPDLEKKMLYYMSYKIKNISNKMFGMDKFFFKKK